MQVLELQILRMSLRFLTMDVDLLKREGCKRMARYIGPKCKLSRSQGVDLGLKSRTRPIETKCQLEKPPGQHGDARGRRRRGRVARLREARAGRERAAGERDVLHGAEGGIRGFLLGVRAAGF